MFDLCFTPFSTNFTCTPFPAKGRLGLSTYSRYSIVKDLSNFSKERKIIMTVMCDLDPDVVRWGLHLIDVCSLANNGSPQTVTCFVEDKSTTDTLKEEFCSKVEPVVENDKAIAQALQEELSRLDQFGSLSSGEQHQKESILAQDWRGPSGRHFSSGRETDYFVS